MPCSDGVRGPNESDNADTCPDIPGLTTQQVAFTTEVQAFDRLIWITSDPWHGSKVDTTLRPSFTPPYAPIRKVSSLGDTTWMRRICVRCAELEAQPLI